MLKGRGDSDVASGDGEPVEEETSRRDRSPFGDKLEILSFRNSLIRKKG
jgi:hypothetical protein